MWTELIEYENEFTDKPFLLTDNGRVCLQANNLAVKLGFIYLTEKCKTMSNYLLKFTVAQQYLCDYSG